MSKRFITDIRGSAAAELALSLPLLILLMMGCFDLGYYFLSEHVVQKSVRDAARYAARLPMTDFPSCSPTTDAEQRIQRVARSGVPDGDYDGDGTIDQRLLGWTEDTMAEVKVDCDDSTSFGGIYADFPDGVVVVTIRATVPYQTLFGYLGLGTASLNLNASSQAAVIGA